MDIMVTFIWANLRGLSVGFIITSWVVYFAYRAFEKQAAAAVGTYTDRPAVIAGLRAMPLWKAILYDMLSVAVFFTFGPFRRLTTWIRTFSFSGASQLQAAAEEIRGFSSLSTRSLFLNACSVRIISDWAILGNISTLYWFIRLVVLFYVYTQDHNLFWICVILFFGYGGPAVGTLLFFFDSMSHTSGSFIQMMQVGEIVYCGFDIGLAIGNINAKGKEPGGWLIRTVVIGLSAAFIGAHLSALSDASLADALKLGYVGAMEGLLNWKLMAAIPPFIAGLGTGCAIGWASGAAGRVMPMWFLSMPNLIALAVSFSGPLTALMIGTKRATALVRIGATSSYCMVVALLMGTNVSAVLVSPFDRVRAWATAGGSHRPDIGSVARISRRSQLAWLLTPVPGIVIGSFLTAFGAVVASADLDLVDPQKFAMGGVFAGLDAVVQGVMVAYNLLVIGTGMAQAVGVLISVFSGSCILSSIVDLWYAIPAGPCRGKGNQVWSLVNTKHAWNTAATIADAFDSTVGPDACVVIVDSSIRVYPPNAKMVISVDELPDVPGAAIVLRKGEELSHDGYRNLAMAMSCESAARDGGGIRRGKLFGCAHTGVCSCVLPSPHWLFPDNPEVGALRVHGDALRNAWGTNHVTVATPVAGNLSMRLMCVIATCAPAKLDSFVGLARAQVFTVDGRRQTWTGTGRLFMGASNFVLVHTTFAMCVPRDAHHYSMLCLADENPNLLCHPCKYRSGKWLDEDFNAELNLDCLRVLTPHEKVKAIPREVYAHPCFNKTPLDIIGERGNWYVSLNGERVALVDRGFSRVADIAQVALRPTANHCDSVPASVQALIEYAAETNAIGATSKTTFQRDVSGMKHEYTSHSRGHPVAITECKTCEAPPIGPHSAAILGIKLWRGEISCHQHSCVHAAGATPDMSVTYDAGGNPTPTGQYVAISIASSRTAPGGFVSTSDPVGFTSLRFAELYGAAFGICASVFLATSVDITTGLTAAVPVSSLLAWLFWAYAKGRASGRLTSLWWDNPQTARDKLIYWFGPGLVVNGIPIAHGGDQQIDETCAFLRRLAMPLLLNVSMALAFRGTTATSGLDFMTAALVSLAGATGIHHLSLLMPSSSNFVDAVARLCTVYNPMSPLFFASRIRFEDADGDIKVVEEAMRFASSLDGTPNLSDFASAVLGRRMTVVQPKHYFPTTCGTYGDHSKEIMGTLRSVLPPDFIGPGKTEIVRDGGVWVPSYSQPIKEEDRTIGPMEALRRKIGEPALTQTGSVTTQISCEHQSLGMLLHRVLGRISVGAEVNFHCAAQAYYHTMRTHCRLGKDERAPLNRENAKACLDSSKYNSTAAVTADMRGLGNTGEMLADPRAWVAATSEEYQRAFTGKHSLTEVDIFPKNEKREFNPSTVSISGVLYNLVLVRPVRLCSIWQQVLARMFTHVWDGIKKNCQRLILAQYFAPGGRPGAPELTLGALIGQCFSRNGVRIDRIAHARDISSMDCRQVPSLMFMNLVCFFAGQSFSAMGSYVSALIYLKTVLTTSRLGSITINMCRSLSSGMFYTTWQNTFSSHFFTYYAFCLCVAANPGKAKVVAAAVGCEIGRNAAYDLLVHQMGPLETDKLVVSIAVGDDAMSIAERMQIAVENGAIVDALQWLGYTGAHIARVCNSLGYTVKEHASSTSIGEVSMCKESFLDLPECIVGSSGTRLLPYAPIKGLIARLATILEPGAVGLEPRDFKENSPRLFTELYMRVLSVLISKSPASLTLLTIAKHIKRALRDAGASDIGAFTVHFSEWLDEPPLRFDRLPEAEDVVLSCGIKPGSLDDVRDLGFANVGAFQRYLAKEFNISSQCHRPTKILFTGATGSGKSVAVVDEVVLHCQTVEDACVVWAGINVELNEQMAARVLAKMPGATVNFITARTAEKLEKNNFTVGINFCSHIIGSMLAAGGRAPKVTLMVVDDFAVTEARHGLDCLHSMLASGVPVLATGADVAEYHELFDTVVTLGRRARRVAEGLSIAIKDSVEFFAAVGRIVSEILSSRARTGRRFTFARVPGLQEANVVAQALLSRGMGPVYYLSATGYSVGMLTAGSTRTKIVWNQLELPGPPTVGALITNTKGEGGLSLEVDGDTILIEATRKSHTSLAGTKFYTAPMSPYSKMQSEGRVRGDQTIHRIIPDAALLEDLPDSEALPDDLLPVSMATLERVSGYLGGSPIGLLAYLMTVSQIVTNSAGSVLLTQFAALLTEYARNPSSVHSRIAVGAKDPIVACISTYSSWVPTQYHKAIELVAAQPHLASALNVARVSAAVATVWHHGGAHTIRTQGKVPRVAPAGIFTVNTLVSRGGQGVQAPLSFPVSVDVPPLYATLLASIPGY